MAKLTASNLKEALAEGELKLSNLNGQVSLAVVRRTPEGERLLYRLYLDDVDITHLAEFLAKTILNEVHH